MNRTPLDEFDDDIEFMCREWYADDRQDDPEDTDEYPEKFYRIYIFGVTEKKQSVCLEVNGFQPFFYVKVPDNWTITNAGSLVDRIKKILWKNSKYLVDFFFVERKDAYGFNNQQKFKFVKLVFNNYKVCRNTTYIFKNANETSEKRKPIQGYENTQFKLYESNIDPMLVFMHIQNISASGWVKVSKSKLKQTELSCCQINLSTDSKNVKPIDKHSIPGLLTCSFDIECYSSSGEFPDPKKADNVITQIGSSFQYFGDSEVYKHIIVLGECDCVEGAELVVVSKEENLLREWVKLIKRMDPDQIIGYNIDDFDWTYMYKRSLRYDSKIFENLGRLEHVRSEFYEKELESNAYGYNSFKYITTPGIGQIDLIHWFRKNTKLDKYSLDFVSQKYLGDTKRDVSVAQIFEWSGPKGTSKTRSVVADYCVQDTALPLRLMMDRVMMPNLIEMSRVTYTPFTWLITRGEQIKAYSQLSRELRNNNYVLPSSIEQEQSDYKGATVFDAEKGAYFEPVSGLDFASLYPSIMIAWNLCPTTWVMDPKYLGIEGVEYHNFKWESYNYTFVQSNLGIIPGILKRLWEERKRVKKLMETEEDKKMYDIINAKQLAIKVSMNSIYGFFGVKTGIFPCQPISATVTHVGRTMIDHSKKCAEEWYNGSEESKGIKAHVIYGDSVPGNTPVTLKIGNFVIPKRIDSINTSCWRQYNEFKADDLHSNRTDKQQAECNTAMIWTDGGWKKIVRVIRHKVTKRLYRVVTSRGVVVCTEDHSLLRKSKEIVKPCELSVGDELLHRTIVL